MIYQALKVSGTFSSMAHFRAVMCKTVGPSLKFNKEVAKAKNGFVHKVHALRFFGEEPRRRQAGTSQLITGRLLIYRIQALKLVGLCFVARVFVARDGHSGSGGPAAGAQPI